MTKEINMPQHVGIIMDGNGRWATKRGLSRSEGHRAGADNLKNYVYTFLKVVLNIFHYMLFLQKILKEIKKKLIFNEFVCKNVYKWIWYINW